jgi:hypothetical protein
MIKKFMSMRMQAISTCTPELGIDLQTYSVNSSSANDAFLFRPSVPRFDHLVSARA